MDNDAFGGFLLGLYQFHQAGMRQNRDFSVQFSGFPVENALALLAEKQVEAAIVPVCLLEELEKEGKFKRSDFRLILQNPQAQGCLASTPLLPNWSLAAMENVPNELAVQLATRLLNSHNPDLPRWTLPFSSAQADHILRELYRHPQQKSLWATVLDWVRLNKFGLLAVVLFILLNLVALRYQVYRKKQGVTAGTLQNAAVSAGTDPSRPPCFVGRDDNRFCSRTETAVVGGANVRRGAESQNSDPYQQRILDKLIAQVDRAVKTMQSIRDWAQTARVVNRKRSF